jgi:hypothetical protein
MIVNEFNNRKWTFSLSYFTSEKLKYIVLLIYFYNNELCKLLHNIL